jgi:hypothetical protein
MSASHVLYTNYQVDIASRAPSATDFAILKDQLSRAKSELDDIYEHKLYHVITSKFDIANTFKHDIHVRYNTPNVSNAWLKIYDMVYHLRLMSTSTSTDSFTVFEPACFPGSMLLACIHLAKTLYNIKNFMWYGSSLFDSHTQSFLGDEYGLMSRYPEHFLNINIDNFHKRETDVPNRSSHPSIINGDLSDINDINSFTERLRDKKTKVDLYIVDLGFDVSADYNRQEEMHAKCLLGQIILGLNVTNVGGNMVLKYFTILEPNSISMLWILTHYFKEVLLYKPLFSKPANSEIYIVLKGYYGCVEDHCAVLLQKMINKLYNWNDIPIIDITGIPCGFLTRLYNIQKSLCINQICTIKLVISEFKRLSSPTFRGTYHINKFSEYNNKVLEEWKKNTLILALSNEDKLNVIEKISKNQSRRPKSFYNRQY